MEQNPSSLNIKKRHLIMGTIALLIVLSVAFSFFSSNKMINESSPLVDATMEIKLNATLAHLWFEEIISGDRTEKIEDVINYIDLAIWYANAMLEGGQNQEGLFIPLTDAMMRKEAAGVVELLKSLKEKTYQRNKMIETSGIGGELDQQYDRFFYDFINKIDNVESMIQQEIRDDFGRFKFVQLFLITFICISIMFAFLLQFRFEQEQKRHFIELRHEKRRAENNSAWLKTTMNSMGDGVIITDEKGLVTYLNPVASSLTGWLFKDAVKRQTTEIFHIVNEQTQEPVEDPIQMVIRNNVVVGLANHTELISKDGRRWPISDSAAPIFDQDSNLSGVVLVFQEITAQKKAEIEKANLEAQLRQAYKMEAIGTMAGGIAHDFNNVLAIILGNVEMALFNITNCNPAKHHIEQISIAANRAKEMVKQILAFSRQKIGIKKPHDLFKLVEESMKSLRSTLPSSVQLKISMPETCGNEKREGQSVLADPTQIHQLLMNLCINAVQAMEEKGFLEVSINSILFQEDIPPNRPGLLPGKYIQLSVADSGPGIQKEVMANIFDPYFTTKDVGKGTGMGLPVVHGIVENHHGKIFVESEPGEGATFHVFLPASDAKPKPQKDEIGPLLEGTERILLVDDEDTLALVGKEILERLGYSVTSISDSVEALKLFQKDPEAFDLVITDQTMPTLLGSELAQRLLKIKPGLPIILCTGYSSQIDREKALQIGIRGFASKPVNRKNLASLMRSLLDSPEEC